MKVISIINYKGGVGKTTLTANIAAGLANQGKKVLAIDLDPQSNLTFSFVQVDVWKEKYQSNKTIKTWYDSFIERGNVKELNNLVIIPKEVNELVKENLHLICSHLALINVDLELGVRLGGVTPRQQKNNFLEVYSILIKGISSLENTYDYILIDCPPNFNIVTKTAIVASDYYLIPSKLDYLSTLGIEQLQKHVSDLVEDYNTNVERYGNCNFKKAMPNSLGVVATMVGIRDGNVFSTQQQYLDDIRKMKIPILESKIRENKSIYADAPRYGIPVILDSQKSHKVIVDELKELTLEFMRKVV